MKWLVSFLTSSIGRKIIMSLTGLFLCTFLVVHMVGNLQLFFDSTGEAFNEYAYFMTHTELIKIISYGLYFFIILHAVQGIAIAMSHRSAVGSGKRYHGKQVTPTEARLAARNMIWLGILLLAFILLHMWQFWAQMKMGVLDKVAGHEDMYDLYAVVKVAFRELWVVLFYLVGLLALALHLIHGFQSAFQTLGLNHKKYTPIIKAVGWIYSIVIPLGFASMPIYFYVLKIMEGGL